MDLGEVTVPNIDVRMLKEQALDLARHISGSDYSERMVVELKKITVDRQPRARTKIGFVPHPEARAIDGAYSAAFPRFGLNHPQPRGGRCRQKDRNRSRGRLPPTARKRVARWGPRRPRSGDRDPTPGASLPYWEGGGSDVM